VNEIVQEFLVETNENLDQLDQDLIALEQTPDSRELLGSVFRTIHTVKGTTGFLGFGRLEDLSHAGENLLSDLRDGRLVLTRERTDVLLEVVDAIRGLLGAIEETGQEDERDLSDLIARIELLQHDDTAPGAPEPAAHAPDAVTASAGPKKTLVVPPPPDFAAGTHAPTPDTERAAARDPATAAPVTSAPPAAPVTSAPAPSVQQAAAAVPPAARSPEGPPPAAAAAGTPADAPHDSRHASERSVRVDVDLLDRIMRQVGELVLARNQISAHAGQSEDVGLHQTVQRLSMIVSELQEGVMKTRMQPVEQLWSKLPRVVRDLSSQFHKQVRLDMEGGETELDRSLLEAVKDPLTHLVRNAIDHGLETPETRSAHGKAPTGVLALRAYHEGGQVVLEVGDDGAGIEPSKIAARAVERGLVSAERIGAMSEREIVDLIFRPGFSTAEVVTNVSGRGVGMDVVRTNVERIGGTVDLLSTPGSGTTFRVKIPLTLAIVPALLVGCSNQRYAIPQANLLEMVQVRPDDAQSQLERIEGALVYRLRGKLLPLVHLSEILGFTAGGEGAGEEGAEPRATSIVVVQADELLLGIVVDDVFGTEEIVVKPLGQHVKQIPVYAGATILGDGGVALILDVIGLASAAQVQEVSRTVAAAQALIEGEVDDLGERSTFVLLRVGAERRVAVPLASVSRLEEAAGTAIEQAGGRPVLQYRGELLPLVRLDEVLDARLADAPRPDSADGVPIVVYSDGERHLGLVAAEILDIVEGVFEVSSVGRGAAIIGSTVVNGRATDVLDVRAAFDLTEGRSHVA
jgi:two-component system chemotaxis sensor kinase CheA